ncbi:hypothetical protein Nepgr_011429 [Nepenthes gracilis]|uniref:Homeobox-leucine zipper protein n=1 Tax=Nepenthes gracilis TaxID=150966 RepID=A0AAD3SE66_NEPGR|nr:hypothetical protein Nepgr_011429 [Nepenthes gracilis]
MRRHKSKMKKRFSDEQIRSLQSVFNSESRLPPQRKQEIAHQLGLEPRQVAVWFQNKRARCKSNQVELDHTILKFSYGSLGSTIDSLERENKSLAAEVYPSTQWRIGGIVSSRSSEGNAAPPDESGKISGGNYVESREYFEQGCDTYSAAEAMDSSQSSSAEGHRLESVLGSDCLLEKNSDSEWWEIWSRFYGNNPNWKKIT